DSIHRVIEDQQRQVQLDVLGQQDSQAQAAQMSFTQDRQGIVALCRCASERDHDSLAAALWKRQVCKDVVRVVLRVEAVVKLLGGIAQVRNQASRQPSAIRPYGS